MTVEFRDVDPETGEVYETHHEPGPVPPPVVPKGTPSGLTAPVSVMVFTASLGFTIGVLSGFIALAMTLPSPLVAAVGIVGMLLLILSGLMLFGLVILSAFRGTIGEAVGTLIIAILSVAVGVLL